MHLKGILFLLFSTSIHASEFYILYSNGFFDDAFQKFDLEVKDSKPGANYENLLDTLYNIFPQTKKQSTSLLKEKILLVKKQKTNLFLKKRIKSDLKNLSIYSKLTKANSGTIENAIREAIAIKEDPLKYNHQKMSRLRMVQMILTYRSFNKLNTISDLYLKALLENAMYDAGRDHLEKYLKQADKNDPFYSKALELNKKFN